MGKLFGKKLKDEIMEENERIIKELGDYLDIYKYLKKGVLTEKDSRDMIVALRMA